MATVKDVYGIIDEFAPFSTAEEWDNSGLLIGDYNQKVNKIIFALDITSYVIDVAVKNSAQLIITHHPVIFKPLKNIDSESLVSKLIKNNISVISAHTNFDVAVNGVNDVLCDIVGFDKFEKVKDSFLNIGYFNEALSFQDFAVLLKNKLDCTVRYNYLNKLIKKVAVCSGSGADFLETSHMLDCDALLTGDGSYHSFIDANNLDMGLFCAGHFETENIAMKPLAEKIYDKLMMDYIVVDEKSPIITL